MTSMSFQDVPTRLDKFVRESTGWSRRIVEDAIHAGRVRHLGAEPQRGPATLIFENDEVLVDGTPIERREARSYFIFFKPSGILTAASDPHGRDCLEPFLEALPDGVFPVGRLDRATTGLLLLTDDGDLAHMLLHPRFHVPKVYHVGLGEPLESDDPRLELLEAGIELKDGPARAIRAVPLEREPPAIEIVIDEGRKHQVRRMIRTAGLELESLHRHTFSNLTLDFDRPGASRELTQAEVESVWESVGGRDRVIARKIDALERQALRLREQARPHLRLERWLEALEARHEDLFPP